jgi:hypothetical protein
MVELSGELSYCDLGCLRDFDKRGILPFQFRQKCTCKYRIGINIAGTQTIWRRLIRLDLFSEFYNRTTHGASTDILGVGDRKSDFVSKNL